MFSARKIGILSQVMPITGASPRMAMLDNEGFEGKCPFRCSFAMIEIWAEDMDFIQIYLLDGWKNHRKLKMVV